MPFKSSISFEVIDALVAGISAALPTAVVSDGYGSFSDPGRFVMLNVATLLTEGPARSVDSNQEWTYANTTTRTEDGSVNGIVWARVGDSDPTAQKAARDDARELLDGVADYVRENWDMPGIEEVLWIGFRMTAMDQDSDNYGTWCHLEFEVGFKAQI